jgi:polysaccharide biosynthesis protein PslA
MALAAHNQGIEQVTTILPTAKTAFNLPASHRLGGRWFSRELLEVISDSFRFIDVIGLILAGFATYFFVEDRLTDELALVHLQGMLVGALSAPFLLHFCGLYRVANVRSRHHAFQATLVGCGSLAVLLSLVALATDLMDRDTFIWGSLWLIVSFVLFLGTRLGAAQVISGMIRGGILYDSVAIVGGGPLADRLVAHLTSMHLNNLDRCPIEIVGIFDDRRDRLPDGCRTLNGSLDDLVTLGKEGVFDRVILTLPWAAERRLLEIVHKLQALAIDVSLCPDGIVFAARKPDTRTDLPFLSLAERPLRRWGAIVKRGEDIVLASLALLLFGPMMCLIALAIRLDSTGPALFRQHRHGFNNREIEVFKFRTMRTDMTDHTGGLQASRGDVRITRLGAILRRTSLDELPQLLNVLKGDMSLVGPRPHPVGMKTQDKLCHEIVEAYAHRHRVKPGITGWAQVNGYRGATSKPEHLTRRVECDLFYIENWSLAFDLKILIKTVTSLFTTENAF